MANSYTWAPSTDLVASFVPNRPQDDSGVFTDTTKPTADQVTEFIQLYCDKVASVAGDPDNFASLATDEAKTRVLDTIKGLATHCAALGAAHHIELSYTSDITADTGGKAAALGTQYDNELKALSTAIAQFNQGQIVGGANVITTMAGSFPTTEPLSTPPGLVTDTNTGLWVIDTEWGIW